MKKSTLVMIATTAILFTNCTSRTLDAVDDLNNLECLNKLLKLNENEDQLSCTDLVSQLNSLKNSCGDEDGDIQAAIVLIQASCEE